MPFADTDHGSLAFPYSEAMGKGFARAIRDSFLAPSSRRIGTRENIESIRETLTRFAISLPLPHLE